MSELPSVDPLDKQLERQVFEAGKALRAGHLVLRQRLVDQAEKERVRADGNEVALAGETERLRNRMGWLYTHPRRSRVLGRAAVGIERGVVYHSTDIISTKPVDDGAILNIREGHLLVSGLIFWQFYKTMNQTLHIDKQVRDETTGAVGSRHLYELFPYDSETGPRVQIHGAPFNGYRGRRQRQVFEAYAVENESIKPFLAHFSDYPGTSDGRRMGLFSTLCIDDWQDKKTAQRLNETVADRMAPGGAWEYPDEMFAEPLAIVRQMNILLGTKNK